MVMLSARKGPKELSPTGSHRLRPTLLCQSSRIGWQDQLMLGELLYLLECPYYGMFPSMIYILFVMLLRLNAIYK
jgi:hypothetical protein